jgi:hypothetical protein
MLRHINRVASLIPLLSFVNAITPRNFSFSAFGPLAAHSQESFLMVADQAAVA